MLHLTFQILVFVLVLLTAYIPKNWIGLTLKRMQKEAPNSTGHECKTYPGNFYIICIVHHKMEIWVTNRELSPSNNSFWTALSFLACSFIRLLISASWEHAQQETHCSHSLYTDQMERDEKKNTCASSRVIILGFTQIVPILIKQ